MKRALLAMGMGTVVAMLAMTGVASADNTTAQALAVTRAQQQFQASGNGTVARWQNAGPSRPTIARPPLFAALRNYTTARIAATRAAAPPASASTAPNAAVRAQQVSAPKLPPTTVAAARGPVPLFFPRPSR